MPSIKKETEEKWKKKLTPEQYKVLREKGTEPAFTGKYVHNKGNGSYVCAACGNPLFSSETKFDSGSGWPSFYDAVSEGNIKLKDQKHHLHTYKDCFTGAQAVKYLLESDLFYPPYTLLQARELCERFLLLGFIKHAYIEGGAFADSEKALYYITPAAALSTAQDQRLAEASTPINPGK